MNGRQTRTKPNAGVSSFEDGASLVSNTGRTPLLDAIFSGLLSPDGRWLTFASKRTGHWALMLLDLSTGEARPLTFGPQDDWDPSFHPNGKFIAFGRSKGGGPQIYGICAFGEVIPPKTSENGPAPR